MRGIGKTGLLDRLADYIEAAQQPKSRSNSRQAFRAPRRGEGIKASTIRKRAVNDGYEFAKEEA